MGILDRLKRLALITKQPVSFSGYLQELGFTKDGLGLKSPELVGGTAAVLMAAVTSLKPSVTLEKSTDFDLKFKPKEDIRQKVRIDESIPEEMQVEGGLIKGATRSAGKGKVITPYLVEGAKLFSGVAKGLTYKSKRTREFHNIGNVTYKPGREFYEGQVGYEKMVYKGDEGDSRVTYFAVFSDPYYGIKENYKRGVVHKPATDKQWTTDYSAWKKPYNYIIKHGKVIPPSKKTLYRVMSHYAPYGDLNDPYNYAKRIVEDNPSAWSQGIDTIVDLKSNREQFISFYKVIAYKEQGTTIERWYLGMVYDAMFKGGPIPLQSRLVQESGSTFEQTSSELFYSSPGSINLSKGTTVGNKK